MKPLNELLFNCLKEAFGTVRITNQGQPMSAMHLPDRSGPRVWLRLRISDWGETYAVNCPFCSDARGRLTINHCWGVIDQKTGDDQLQLCHCHNESCVTTRESQKRLHAIVYPQGEFARLLKDIPSPPRFEVAVSPPKKITLPGSVIPLHELPPNHEANRYLAGRFFNPENLGRYLGVSYCSQSHYMLARNRIIVPVYQNGKLEGWQARYIGDLHWKVKGTPPKWWTCPGMKKTQLLYNLDIARRYSTGVVVEGAGDVWSFGPMAVATFGCTISSLQQTSLLDAFGSGSLVLLWDPDVQADPNKKLKYDELLSRLRQAGFRHGVASVILPEGTDPGSMDRQWLRNYVAQAARGQGVQVSWTRKTSVTPPCHEVLTDVAVRKPARSIA